MRHIPKLQWNDWPLFLFLGLRAIHDLGIIYRDVKLKNVLLSDSGNLVITDFGLSKWLNRRQRTHTICGTLAFMAPEIAKSIPYDHKVDYWSLGVLIYCLAFAKSPFSKAKDHEQLAEIHEKENSAILKSIIVDEQNPKVQKLLKGLLRAENPEERTFERTLDDPFRPNVTFIDTLLLCHKS
jgi:serine/threonine protein kinase